MPTLGLALALALSQVLPTEPVEPAPAEAVPWRSSRVTAGLSFGATSWPGLRDLGRMEVPPGWAPFGAGFVVEASVLYNALYFHGAELLVGASGGLNTTRAGQPAGPPLNLQGQPAPNSWLIATDVYASMDARIQPSAGPLRPFASAGVGAMDLTISMDEVGYLGPSDPTQDVLHRSRPMAWLGVGADYRFGPPELCWGLVAELRVQFVDMGSAPGVATGASTLRGPIYSITLGGLFGVGGH